MRTATRWKTRLRLLTVVMAGAVALTACSSSGNGSGGSTSGGSAGGGPSTPSVSDLTAAQIDWAAKFLGSGQKGKAEASLSPVVFGYVNEEGGTLSFAEATPAMNATVKFINDQLGGINGHPLVVHTCFAASPSDVGKCGQQMANDNDVKSIIVPLLLLNNQEFYSPIAGKKPILAGGLFFPVDYTTPNVFSYNPGGVTIARGAALFASQTLRAKRLVNIRTDNPAGLAASQLTISQAKALGMETVDVPVTEPGTAPAYVAAIRAANLKPGDVLDLSLTSSGGATVYDALRTLNLTDIPVLAGNELAGAPPMPGHLKDLGLEDTVFPDGWYMEDPGYTAYMPVPNSNGADVYVSMMKRYASDAPSLYGYATVAFRETMEMAKFLIETGGPDSTSEKLSQAIKTFKGPSVMAAGELRCGALSGSPNLCQFAVGYEQRKDGRWVSVADGLNGKAIETLK